jgi:hypothetical protein
MRASAVTNGVNPPEVPKRMRQKYEYRHAAHDDNGWRLRD